jgi:hypothetical protein
LALARHKGSHFVFFLLRLWFKDIFLLFLALLLGGMIGAAVIGTSKIVGEKSK